jgi:hypothetical protein
MIWILAVLLMATCAQADVTRKHHIASDFIGASEGTTTDFYAADRHAQQSNLRFTRGVMKTMSGGKEQQSGEITRLDKELMWHVDLKDKSYTEMTFAEFREMLKKSEQQLKDAQRETPADTVKEDMYTWQVEDKSEKNPKTIAGFTCRNAQIVATGTSKYDSLDKVMITVNTWNCPDVPGAADIQAYNERYVKALGLDSKILTPGLMQAAMNYQKQFDALIEAAKKAPGEPVQSLMEVKRHEIKRPDVGAALKEGAKEELMSKLPFGKKKSQPKEQKIEYVDNIKFSVQTDLIEATAGAVDASAYEVPAGFKLKKK